MGLREELAQLDFLVQPETVVLMVLMEHLDLLDQLGHRDPPELLDLPGQEARPDRQVLLVTVDYLVSQEFKELKDHKGLKGSPEFKDL